MLTEHPPDLDSPPAEPASWASRILVPEMWGAAVIAIMWIAVLFVGIYGPNIIINGSSGYRNIPSVLVVAFFALLGTVAVARRAFRNGRAS